jgi:hypothetical protein
MEKVILKAPGSSWWINIYRHFTHRHFTTSEVDNWYSACVDEIAKYGGQVNREYVGDVYVFNAVFDSEEKATIFLLRWA